MAYTRARDYGQRYTSDPGSRRRFVDVPGRIQPRSPWMAMDIAKRASPFAKRAIATASTLDLMARDRWRWLLCGHYVAGPPIMGRVVLNRRRPRGSGAKS